MQHKYAASEAFYRRSLSIWDKAGETKSIDLAQTLQNFGELCLDLRRYAEAAPLLTRALAMKEESLGAQRPELARVLLGLAAASMLQGNFQGAEPYCQRAIGILEQSTPPNYEELALALRTYAQLLHNTRRQAQAELTETRAMVYAAKAKNKPSTDIAFAAPDP
jgi:tetratricopeptide (TPR) repeat protein